MNKEKAMKMAMEWSKETEGEILNYECASWTFVDIWLFIEWLYDKKHIIFKTTSLSI